MSEHSPEPWGCYPWEAGEYVIYTPSTGTRFGPPKHLPNVTADKTVARLIKCSGADAARIVACVNACAGVSDADIPLLANVVKHAIKGRNLYPDQAAWQTGINEPVLEWALKMLYGVDTNVRIMPPQKAEKGYRWVSPDK